MAQIQRAYNGLNGVEVKTLIQAEIKSETIERLQAHWGNRLRVEFEYVMRLESYPSERPLAVSLKGERNGTGEEIAASILAAIKQTYDQNTEFSLNHAFPKVTWSQSLSLKAWSTAVAQPKPDPEPVPAGEVDKRVVGSFDASQTPDRLRIADLERQIAELRASIVGGPAAPVKEMIGAGTTAPRTGVLGDGVFRTSADSGDPNKPPMRMDGGAKAVPADRPIEDMVGSMGRGSHVGVLQPKETLVDEVVISREHPSLELGGAGHPDAARRAAGMQVPTPTRVGGPIPQIVDFPLGEL